MKEARKDIYGGDGDSAVLMVVMLRKISMRIEMMRMVVVVVMVLMVVMVMKMSMRIEMMRMVVVVVIVLC